MSPRACSRLWQVEAVQDGCLSAADAASFERHVETCQACAAARAGLFQLQNVAQRLPALESTPLRRRALHNELLRRANEQAVGQTAPSMWGGKARYVFAAGALSLAMLAGLRLAPWHAAESPAKAAQSAKLVPAAANAEPRFELKTDRDSHWHVAERGSALRLAMGNGTFALAVHKLEPGQTFALVLPDGELEVRGTRFVVQIADGQTTQVTVTEGHVALRLNQQAAISLTAGQSWSLPVLVASQTPATAPAFATPTTSSTPRRAVAAVAAAAPNAPGSGANSTRAAKASSKSTEKTSPAAVEFAEAMAAFSRSDFGTAERLFADFERRYPTSTHREDVLFLRALGHSRRGDSAGARALAQQYLQQYPHGFRVPEATKLAETVP